MFAQSKWHKFDGQQSGGDLLPVGRSLGSDCNWGCGSCAVPSEHCLLGCLDHVSIPNQGCNWERFDAALPLSLLLPTLQAELLLGHGLDFVETVQGDGLCHLKKLCGVMLQALLMSHIMIDV